jgi:putative chitinase
MRKPIFDTIRAQRGKGFSADEIAAVDVLLDRLGLEKDEEPVAMPAAEPVTVAAANGSVGLDNEKAFFDELRNSGIFGNGLSPDQVKGLQTVCSAAQTAGWPLAFTAYALATACHETAYTMQPVREGLRASENWRRTNLKRYYPYYGRGYVQLTWEDNYKKADRELSLNGQLTSNLDLALDPDIAARIMVRGMQEGWFAGDQKGKHTLARHLPAEGAASVAQLTSARRIINGTDKNDKIAAEAIKFQKALQAGGW